MPIGRSVCGRTQPRRFALENAREYGDPAREAEDSAGNGVKTPCYIRHFALLGGGCRTTLGAVLLRLGGADDLGRSRQEFFLSVVVERGRARMDAAGSAWMTPDPNAVERVGGGPARFGHSTRSPRAARQQRAAARGSRGAKIAVISTDAAAIVSSMSVAVWLRQVTVGGPPQAIGPVLLTGSGRSARSGSACSRATSSTPRPRSRASPPKSAGCCMQLRLRSRAPRSSACSSAPRRRGSGCY